MLGHFGQEGSYQEASHRGRYRQDAKRHAQAMLLARMSAPLATSRQAHTPGLLTLGPDHSVQADAFGAARFQRPDLMKSAAIFIALCAASVAGEPATIPKAELSLGGVALGDGESRVYEVLGPRAPIDTGEGWDLPYEGLTVSIGWLEQAGPGKERHVTSLEATGPGACTPAGVCPGSPIAVAEAAYGPPLKAVRETGTVLEFYGNDTSCWLQLGISGDEIAAIRAVCQP